MDTLSRPPAAPLSARRWVVPHKKWTPSASPLPSAAAPHPASASSASTLADSSFRSAQVPSNAFFANASAAHLPPPPRMIPVHARSPGGAWDAASWGNGSAAEGCSDARNDGAQQRGDAAVPGGAQGDAGWRKRKSHLSAAPYDSACLTSSHGAHTPAAVLPHPSHAPPRTDTPSAHPYSSASPSSHATRWDVPLFSSKRARLPPDQRRPAEAAAWADRSAAWGKGPAAFHAQGREAAAAAAAVVAGKGEARGGAWRALSASSVGFAPESAQLPAHVSAQLVSDSDALLKAPGGGAPLAFAMGAAPDARRGFHHPASSGRSIGASLESGARTRRGVCAQGRKRRGGDSSGSGGGSAQQSARAVRTEYYGAGLVPGGSAGGEGDQSSCAYASVNGDAEEAERGEEEGDRGEGGQADSGVRPRRRRRKMGLVGVAEEAEEGDGERALKASAAAPDLAGQTADGSVSWQGSGVARAHGGQPAREASAAAAGARVTHGACFNPEESSGAGSASGYVSAYGCYSARGGGGATGAGEGESAAGEQPGRGRNGRRQHESENLAGRAGSRRGTREAGGCMDDGGSKRQRQRAAVGREVAEEGRGEVEEGEEEMKRRFSVQVRSQVGREEEDDGALQPLHQGEDSRCMLPPDRAGSATFVLSSGRNLSAEVVPTCKKKPTIDDEFEQYFAQLLL